VKKAYEFHYRTQQDLDNEKIYKIIWDPYCGLRSVSFYGWYPTKKNITRDKLRIREYMGLSRWSNCEKEEEMQDRFLKDFLDAINLWQKGRQIFQ
jgi:hypothetical protein